MVRCLLEEIRFYAQPKKILFYLTILTYMLLLENRFTIKRKSSRYYVQEIMNLMLKL